MSGKGGFIPGSGRPKGVPNKFTANVKAMILGALDKAGGMEYLYRQSELNPTAFMTLVGKVLPMQLTGDGGGPVMVITGVVRAEDDEKSSSNADNANTDGN